MSDDAGKELTQDKIDALHEGLRDIGLYENQVRWLPNMEEMSEDDFPDVMPERRKSHRQVLIIDLHVGDLAFMKRVQAPDEHAIDTTVAVMEAQLAEQDWDEMQQEIARRLAEGKDPFGED